MKKFLFAVIVITTFLSSAQNNQVLDNTSLDYEVLSISEATKIPQETNYTKLFCNNKVITNVDELTPSGDLKLVIYSGDVSNLINLSDKYEITLPGEYNYDFSYSKDYILAHNENISINISKDRSPYQDVSWYIDYYQNRFYTSKDYLSANNITLHEDTTEIINSKKAKILTLTKHYDNINDTTYTYAFIQTSGQYYTRICIKSNYIFNEEYKNMYEKILSSYKENDILIPEDYTFSNDYINTSTSNYFLDLKPIVNSKWDEKTKKLYNEFITSENIKFGIFTEKIETTAIEEKIPSLEKELEYSFEIILMYNHLGNPLPIDTMKKMKEKNKIIELTIQTCANNNMKLFDYTPIFDIIEGKKDDIIRNLAKEIKSFENPVLFRLNNEMNSDWTSYSGIIALSDPEIYKEVWKRIYTIFDEENVTNCIWIFNPNDNNYPPSKWNNFLSYYPGNEYVQMLGITGYNTGTYYSAQTGETWKSFKTIYDNINSKYTGLFDSFPWIITEFASSSIGGNKVKWIEEMFNNIKDYKNIKAAVWFSAADYDYSTKPAKVARPYYLDETAETLNAFKEGLKTM